jgi:iron(III) transport system ATP-binding protein
MICLEVENLVKTFGAVQALREVSLRIEPGELFFLLGASGCGKTTLLRSIAGFYKPDSGKILFDGEDVTRLEVHKRNTGMVFQSYALWPHMTVAQNVAFGLEQRGVSKDEIRARVDEALQSVRMESYGNRRPEELSGGQQQRVALARALVIRPKCLLLDEPLSNLDARLRQEMRGEIRRVCKEYGVTTVYVTHDQKEALSVADRIALLEDGRLLQVGSPVEIYRRPVSCRVADFIGETNFIQAKIIRVEGRTALVETPVGVLEGVWSQESAAEEGQQVVVSIRPESLHMEAYPVEENGFSGRIGSSVYYGEMVRHEVDCNGVSLKVFELNPHMTGDRQTNTYLWAHAEDVVVLPE